MSTPAERPAVEACRRLLLLGSTVGQDAVASPGALARRARQVGISVTLLRQWQRRYLHGGLEALVPRHWSEVPEATWLLAEQRRAALGEFADAEHVSAADLASLAATQGWTLRQAQRWLRRYRTAGLLGLVPTKRTAGERSLPDLGALSDAQRDELFRRRDLLGELADQAGVPNHLLAARAVAVGVSLRTLRAYHTRFQRAGLAGLAPRTRADKGQHHVLSAHMTQVVESLRLTHRDAPIRFIHELAAVAAASSGDEEPSLFQVRAICAQIPAPVRLLADGREAEFRNRYRLTYPLTHEAHRRVWQIDHKDPVPVLVRDLRAASHRTASGEVRPYLTLVIDSAARLVLAGLFSYDPPDRFMVAAAIREALRITEQKPYGGVPDEIWVDNGKDLVARHVQELTRGLGITLFAGPPYQPQLRGIVERFHGTLATGLWATLPGYVGPNVVVRNPTAQAELTLTELDQRFRTFLTQYHQEVHSATGQTPLAFWQAHATPLPVDERLLDLLLKESATRRVLKEGIKYAGEVYWHAELAVLVGADVLVRAAPSYRAPDELEVFYAGQWRCTALALSSARGAAIPREVVAAAQQRQRAQAHRRIAQARETLEPAPAAPVAPRARRPKQPPPLPTTPPAAGPPTDAAPPTPPPSARATDVFDYLLARPDAPASAKDPAHDP